MVEVATPPTGSRERIRAKAGAVGIKPGRAFPDIDAMVDVAAREALTIVRERIHHAWGQRHVVVEELLRELSDGETPMTRTLKDYRPQHDNNCASGVTDEMGYFEHDPPVPCSCGLADLLKAGEWQPIETAPKDGTAILGTHLYTGALMWVAAIAWRIDDAEWWSEGPALRDDDGDAVHGGPVGNTWPVTHWRLLPPPPDEATR